VVFELKFREISRLEFEYNLIEFLLGTPNLDETWTSDLYLNPVTNSTLGKGLKFELGIS
jgi:hypothetical protein